MAGGARDDPTDPVSLYDVRRVDPGQEIVDTSGFSDADLDQITRLLTALAHWRQTEERLRAASRTYMKLNDTDMRALRYIIFAGHQGVVVTPRSLSRHLEISSASTTKLLDRLERAGHIVRSPHATDRRAIVVTVTEETHAAASSSVGRMQANRFHAAARLSPDHRQTVIHFLDDLSESMSAGLGPPDGAPVRPAAE